MDLELLVFIMLCLFFIVGVLFYISHIISGWLIDDCEEDFDDVEGIKYVFKDENKL